MSQLTLRFPSLVRRHDHTELCASIGDERELNISIYAPSNLLDRLTPSIIPFLPIALVVAGQERRSLHIDAGVDDTWWLNLMGGFWPLVKRFFEFDEITVTRKETGLFAKPLNNEIALMFSAGIDSLYSLKKMKDLGVLPDWFVNINAGAHDQHRDCWAQRVANVKEVAREVGVGLITIDTNFHDVFNVIHLNGHSIRNLAAAYSLFPGVARFGYSSAHVFEDISYVLARNHGISHIDHAVCSTLTPSVISLIILGWDSDRIAKTATVGEDHLAHRFLDVCVNGEYQSKRTATEPINCGQCAKCIRTMVTLDHFKLLQYFKSQFPIEKYFNARETAILALSNSIDPLDLAVMQLVVRSPQKSRSALRDRMAAWLSEVWVR